ncbi:MAG TPA: PH domain-containing protein [Stellaceae bacterium]|nr:PH domain-containing protein [Stellaceae bacterium]
MSYIQKVLQPNETLIYQARLHWLVYARAVLFLVIAVVFAVAGYYAGGQDLLHAALALAALSLLIAVVSGIHAAIKRASTELAVTDHRVIFKRGIISRYTIEMARSKIESIDVQQSFWGRIFNYGTILVRGTGGSLEPFRDIERPIQLRSSITAS